MANHQKVLMGAPSVQEFLGQFRTEKDAAKFITKHIQPWDKIVCPHCGCSDVIYSYGTGRLYQCGHCKQAIAIFNGTMFEGMQANFKNWLYILYSLFVSRKSVSTRQLARETHIETETIYKLRRRAQVAMNNFDLEPFSGVVQMDEVYLGGSNHGRTCKKSLGVGQDTYPVFGIYEQENNRVYSYPAIANDKGQKLTGEQIKTFVEQTCKTGATIVSDEWKSYRIFDKKDSQYKHKRVNHADRKYVNEEGYTTNGIEQYWGIVKKTYYGTHAFYSTKWAHLYLAESDFRYNYRDWKDAIDAMLSQGVFFPLVIDIRKMGRFANKTYDLKKYRMILPKCFDDTELSDISASDILLCEEPVFGILREEYKTIKERHYTHPNYPDDWQALGMIKGGTGYKDYRGKVTNTIDDVSDMIKDATKHKDVNHYVGIENGKPRNRKTEEYRRYNRNYLLKKRYALMPPAVQTQIKLEYPGILKITDKDKVTEIKRRMNRLNRWYSNTFVEAN